MSEIRLQHSELPFFMSTNYADFDMDRVFQWLSHEAYWSKGIPRTTLERSFENSLAFGLFHESEGQVGVARMVTDKAVFAYLADVFIAKNYRGFGLGQWLMEVILQHPDLQGLRRMLLATSDMHALYRKFGFSDAHGSKLLMEIVRPDIYQKSEA